MKCSFISLFVLLAVLLSGCSDNTAKENMTTNNLEVEEISVEEVGTSEVTAAEAIVEEPEVTEEVVNAFLEKYENSTEGYEQTKQISENTYQSYVTGVPSDTYTTWKFTPGIAEPEKLYEISFPNDGIENGPTKSSRISHKFQFDEGFYVFEPITSLNEETVAAISSGYFPFSNLRLGMTEEDALMVQPDFYQRYESINSDWFYGTELTYSISHDTGLVNQIQVFAEAFSDNRTMKDIEKLFGKPVNEGKKDSNIVTYYDFAMGDYILTVNVIHKDEEWYTMEITKKDE